MAINRKTMAAIKRYYDNRRAHNEDRSVPWDKQADLQAIDAASDKWHFTAIAGTFWFQRTHRRTQITLKTDEHRFPEFERMTRTIPKT